MKFKKKPVIIDAVQWNGINIVECVGFLGESFHSQDGEKIVIKTLEGNIFASINDWLIKGIKGECYPCKPDIFISTYESVDQNERQKP